MSCNERTISCKPRQFSLGPLRPPTEEVVAFIDAHRDRESGGRQWGVEPICAQLQIAPSTYYDVKSRPLSNRAVRDAQLGPQLEVIFKKNYSVYGKRKLLKAALRQGLEVGRDQVARLMKRQCIARLSCEETLHDAFQRHSPARAGPRQ